MPATPRSELRRLADLGAEDCTRLALALAEARDRFQMISARLAAGHPVGTCPVPYSAEDLASMLATLARHTGAVDALMAAAYDRAERSQ